MPNKFKTGYYLLIYCLIYKNKTQIKVIKIYKNFLGLVKIFNIVAKKF